MTITGNLIDIHSKTIFKAIVEIEAGKIKSISETDGKVDDQFILPGFVDAHVHIESSMLVPTEFARMAVVHGTVATVSDPHEIGNVLGVDGVEFMIENGNKSPFKFYFGAPSCVPATTFETAGAEIDVEDVEYLLSKPEIVYLAEMMNWPGVLNGDKTVFDKITAAKKHNKPIDGHAPGLMGDMAKNYIAAGISTDHECFTKEEAQGKLDHGMWIQIREGSAAKNFEALADLIHDNWERMMFCSDDKHPDSLLEGHLNLLVKRALAKGLDLFKVLQVACVNPVKHYKLDVGLLQVGDKADFITIDNPTDFNIIGTYINGQLLAESGESKLLHQTCDHPNKFNIEAIDKSQLQVKSSSSSIAVIEALDGELITNRLDLSPTLDDNLIISDVQNDILKIIVVNRYKKVAPAVSFIKNFGLNKGALASSVSHDSHNIVAVGVSDEDITNAINLVIENKGGLSAVDGVHNNFIPLPIAGLMTDEDGYKVAEQYTLLDRQVKEMGSTLGSPFMTLSFMALLVIPKLKLSDLGLFDGEKFEFTS
ncbi:MAG: adenine deaminase [Patiriisocius sp.]|jgi:adenine deaminase